jgi:dipicolinate synthase subunit A
LAEELNRLGAKVKLVGFSKEYARDGLDIVESLENALENAKVAIAPMAGTDDEGKINAPFSSKPLYLTKTNLGLMRGDGLFLIGTAKPIVKKLCADNNLKLIELANLDEIAIPNAIPTAEGAIQLTMEKLPITINGAKAAILGFGRVGFAVNKILKALNADTVVVARKLSALALAEEMGAKTSTFDNLLDAIQDVDVIYNTVPHLVLTREVLMALPRNILIIDLASAPGGVDFSAAKELGIEAFLALGLPGKVAPKTAGQILAKYVPQIIFRELCSV